MSSQGDIESFFYRSLENRVNEKMLDDFSYNIPLPMLRNYINKIINIPYEEFLYFIISWDYPPITTEEMTQSSSFSASEIEMCNILCENDNPGYTFEEIGRLFPHYCKSQTDCALRKYGENQVKTSKQLGLVFPYYNSWYLSCFGYVYRELDESARASFIARSILRDPFYGTIIRDLLSHDVKINDYLKGLSPSTIQRRASGILRILQYALDELSSCGIEHYSCNCDRAQLALNTAKKEGTKFLFSKKLTKSFLTRGVTIPINTTEDIVDIICTKIDKGTSLPVHVIFEDVNYDARINHINLSDSDRTLYQIYWKSNSGLSDALAEFVSSNKVDSFKIFGVEGESTFIISTDIDYSIIDSYKCENIIVSESSIVSESCSQYQYNKMATLIDLYQTKRILEELNQEVPAAVLEQISILESEEFSKIADNLIFQFPRSIETGAFQGSFTIIAEYDNGNMVRFNANKSTSLFDNKCDMLQQNTPAIVAETDMVPISDFGAKGNECDNEVNNSGDLRLCSESIRLEVAPKPKGKNARFSLNGSEPMAKNRSVLESVRRFISQFPDATFEDIAEMFPKHLQGSYGVVRTIDDITVRSTKNKSESDRWFLDPSEILTAADGKRFAVSTEWGHQFSQFQKHLADAFGWLLEEV